MERIASALLAVLAVPLAAGQAKAATLRDLCPDRPGLGTPPCTIDRGHALVEIGLGDWTLTRQSGAREDDLATGDLLVRYGLSTDLEMQVGITAYTHIRTRAGNLVSRERGAGDLFVAFRRNLSNPDGSGFSAALMPYATLPTGRNEIGAGDWGAGLIVPVTYQLSRTFILDLTAEADAAVDGDRSGRHLAYSAVLGLDTNVTDKIGAAIELSAARDEDPGGHSSQLIAGLSVDYTPHGDTQFDVGANLGLDRNAPDVELYFGIAHRF